ncbi:hypothetical protein OXX80_004305 [Metschnikowia pulcherrima]
MNIGSSWGNSSGFGTSTGSKGFSLGNNSSAPSSSGGLLGNKPAGPAFGAQAPSGTFPSLNGGQNPTGANPAAPSNLFGASSGGLFGNSAKTGASQPGGLFGNSSTTQSNGMGNANAPKPSSGLFGSSQQSSSSTSQPSSGLFGNSTQPNAPLFGSSGQANNSLFGNSTGVSSAPASSLGSGNPYGQNNVLANIAKSESSMPPSITSSLFEDPKTDVKHANRITERSANLSSKPSFVSRLAKTFNIFRSTTNSKANSGSARFNGVFTQQNSVDDRAELSGSNKPEREHAIMPAQSLNYVENYKKLVIKSKPSKFHLIDTESVFKAKRKRAIVSMQDSSDEVDSSDDEAANSRPAKVAKTDAMSQPVTESITPTLKDTDNGALETPGNSEGYFCSPSLKELSTYPPSKLSEVEDFIVGRVGYGQISYIYPVDLSALFEKCNNDITAISRELFGRIVKLETSVVRVYDDPGLDPPKMGHELNVPATITLKAPPKGRTIEAHIKRLRNLTGMDFITYDPITLTWTFAVKHFSVWGLIDDSENEGDETEELTRLRKLKEKQDMEEPEASVVYSRLYQDERYQNELKRQKIERQTSGIPGGWDFDTTCATEDVLSAKQNSVQNEINREVNAFKESKFAHALAANASDITNDSDEDMLEQAPKEQLSEDNFFPSDARNYDYLKQIVKDTPVDNDMSELVDEKAYEPEISDEAIFNNLTHHSTLATSRNWALQLELANTLESALAPSVASDGKSRLQTLNSINNILFANIGEEEMEPDESSAPANFEHKIGTEQKKSIALNQSLQVGPLRDIISRSTIRSRHNKFPEASFEEPLTFTTISAIFKDNPDFKYLRLAAILFDKPCLGSLLDSELADETLVKRIETGARKKEMTRWMRQYVNDLSHPKSMDKNEEIFGNVCAGDVKRAVELATASKNLHLASLMTLLDANDQTVRYLASGQIESWETSNSLAHIPDAIVKVFKVLSGDFAYFESSLSDEVLLSLHLNYGNPAETVEDVFKDHFSDSKMGQLGEMLQIHSAMQTKGSQDAGSLLSRSTLCNEFKWLMLQVLKSSDMDCSLSLDSVALSYGDELEASGLWKEAVFVFSTMHDEALVEEKIRSAVLSNATDFAHDGVDENSPLVEEYKVPLGLLHEACAIGNKRKGDMWGCAESYVTAGLWKDAHDTICEELGPSVVISEDAVLSARLESIISCFPEEGGIVPNWNQGAGFYAKYLDIMKAAEEHRTVETNDIVFLLENAAQVKTKKTFKQNVASKIVSKQIAELAIDHRDDIPDVPRKIQALAVGENEKVYFESRLHLCEVHLMS